MTPPDSRPLGSTNDDITDPSPDALRLTPDDALEDDASPETTADDSSWDDDDEDYADGLASRFQKDAYGDLRKSAAVRRSVLGPSRSIKPAKRKRRPKRGSSGEDDD